MIEKARTVQAEWADAHDQASLAAFEAEEAAAENAAQAAVAQSISTTPTSAAPGTLSNGVKKESPDTDQTPSSTPAHIPNSTSSPAPVNNVSISSQQASQISAPLRPRRQFLPPPNPHRGQLLPAHLREAQRRTKRSGEGGGVGFSGLSMDSLGVKGSYTWNSGTVGGRRLFR